MHSLKNVVWTEKYRPSSVTEMVGDFKDKMKKYLENPNNIQNFLLYSNSPGTGKTSLALAIVNELGCDHLVINSSDDRNIDTIREKVKEFARTKSTKEGLRRAIIMDEFDGCTKISQEALRATIEMYAGNSFYIFTANNVNKIIEPIRSRCVEVPFAYPSKDEIRNYLIMICENEALKYTIDGLNKIIDINYPSIRNCVVVLQDLHTENKEITEENIRPVNELFEQMWQNMKEKKWRDIKEYVMSSTVDARELNMYFWQKGLIEENIKVIQLACRNERDMAFGSDAKIIFVTSLIEMIK